jgi:acyl-CoA synthetase (AMP-forming)/AMP-acid ligase II
MNHRLVLLCPNLDPRNDQAAIYEKGRTITFGELAGGVSNLSDNIVRAGAFRGSRIALSYDNTAAFVYGYLAILGAECIPVLLSPNLPAEKLSYILADCCAAGMISESRVLNRIPSYPRSMRFLFSHDVCESAGLRGIAVYSFDEGLSSNRIPVDNGAVQELYAEAQPQEISSIASIIYTSGTTGKPKGVMLSEANLELATATIIRHLGLTPVDSCLVAMSFAHCAGLLHMIAHLRAGAKLVTGETFALIGQFLAAIKKHRVTILPAVPSFYTLLTKHPKHKVRPYLNTIRAVESSSAMISSSLIREIVDLFPSAALFNTYGLTEAPRTTYTVVSPSDATSRLSVGQATSGVAVKVVNEHFQRCLPYEEGEIVVEGANLALGYWNNSEKTSAAFGPLGFRTGDLGYMDQKGFLFLKGRRDDMIKIGAEAVSPHEVEEVIGSHPGVADVLVYGVEDDVRGFAIHVQVVRKDECIDEESLFNYCCGRLEKHKLPSRISFHDSIVVEESGKPKRSKATV